MCSTHLVCEYICKTHTYLVKEDWLTTFFCTAGAKRLETITHQLLFVIFLCIFHHICHVKQNFINQSLLLEIVLIVNKSYEQVANESGQS